ncbi:MAG: TonB-dependent receptor plug domain-containing protein [Synechococcales cyanobacterium CRU_2_2]|nr:TonB-dependent receptor plug domain-containing protein [Synechococcales cyanobacterium CRU_2_2]
MTSILCCLGVTGEQAIAGDLLASDLPADRLANDLNEDAEDGIRVNVTGEVLDQPISSPTRGESTLRDVTRPAYVINREQLQQQGARTVKEGLQFVPGILGGGTVGTEVNALSGQFIRGSNNTQVLILLDGRPINALGAGGFDLSEISTDSVERIEVLPGGGSVLYGSDAIGGVVNIITRQPSEGLSGSVSATLGSYGYDDQTLQFSGTEDKLGYFFSYNRIQADNDYPFEVAGFDQTRENNDAKYDNLTLRLNYPVGDRTQLSFSALYLPKEQGVPGGVPIAEPLFGQGFSMS